MAFAWAGEWGAPRRAITTSRGFALIGSGYATESGIDLITPDGSRTPVQPVEANRSVPRFQWFHRGDEAWLARWGNDRLQVGRFAPGTSFTPEVDVPVGRHIKAVGTLDPDRLLVLSDTVDTPARLEVLGFDGRVLEPRSALPGAPASVRMQEHPDGRAFVVESRWVGTNLEVRAGGPFEATQPLMLGACPERDTCYLCCGYSVQSLGDDLAWIWATPSRLTVGVGVPGGVNRVERALEAHEQIRSLRFGRGPDGTLVLLVARPRAGGESFDEVTLHVLDAETLSELVSATLELDFGPDRTLRDLGRLAPDPLGSTIAFDVGADGPGSRVQHRWVLAHICLPE